jgi:hypothetical protein
MRLMTFVTTVLYSRPDVSSPPRSCQVERTACRPVLQQTRPAADATFSPRPATKRRAEYEMTTCFCATVPSDPVIVARLAAWAVNTCATHHFRAAPADDVDFWLRRASPTTCAKLQNTLRTSLRAAGCPLPQQPKEWIREVSQAELEEARAVDEGPAEPPTRPQPQTIAGEASPPASEIDVSAASESSESCDAEPTADVEQAPQQAPQLQVKDAFSRRPPLKTYVFEYPSKLSADFDERSRRMAQELRV